MLNYPSNPTGGTYRLEELKALARVAAAHKVLLISDEIYGELHHKGQHVSIARFYPEGTIISSGLSKWCHRRLTDAGVGCIRPVGGFYLLPEFRPLADKFAARGITTSRQLVTSLLEDTGVAILPGADFGREDDELSARLAYVDFDGTAALAAVAELGDQSPDEAFLREHMPRITDGMDRIVAWLPT